MADSLHRKLIESKGAVMAVMTTVFISIGGLVEIAPLYSQALGPEPMEGIEPLTPLELAGRDIYVREGCYNCHSQMVRPIRAETERYGEYSKPGEFVYDHPFQWGSRRIGPDLHRVGGKYPHLWHVRHMEDPKSTTPQSIMPAYPWLLTNETDFDSVQERIDAMLMLGVPYGDFVKGAEESARAQAHAIAQEIGAQGGDAAGLESKQIVALTAYLQRLGTDLFKAPAGATKAVEVSRAAQ